MKLMLVAVALMVSSALVIAQEEKKVPKDSERVYIPGCARGRSFVVAQRLETEPVRTDVAPGRRFRLSGPKKILDEIKAREINMIEVTGLVRKSDLNPPNAGVAIAGGRIRIGGPLPRDPIAGDPKRDPLYSEAIIDVEAWRQLPAECPTR
jgi:hypothetical protein